MGYCGKSVLQILCANRIVYHIFKSNPQVSFKIAESLKKESCNNQFLNIFAGARCFRYKNSKILKIISGFCFHYNT